MPTPNALALNASIARAAACPSADSTRRINLKKK
jgi:hypothetical protein